MKSIESIRSQVAPIIDYDFFFGNISLVSSYEDDEIARIVKGAIYSRTLENIKEFISRCEQTLSE